MSWIPVGWSSNVVVVQGDQTAASIPWVAIRMDQQVVAVRFQEAGRRGACCPWWKLNP